MASQSNLQTTREFSDRGLLLQHFRPHDPAILASCRRYYNSYTGWVKPVINLICDNAASTAYEELSSVSTNPQVVNPASCDTNYCSVVINWRTSAVCSGGAGWTIVILICVAAGLYVGGGIGYTRYENGHWDASDGKILAAHPHWRYWQELPGLVQEGIAFTKQVVSRGSVGGAKQASSSWDDYDELLGERDEGAVSSRPASPARGRRSSEPATGAKKKRKKRKQKPRPSEPMISTDADGGKE